MELRPDVAAFEVVAELFDSGEVGLVELATIAKPYGQTFLAVTRFGRRRAQLSRLNLALDFESFATEIHDQAKHFAQFAEHAAVADLFAIDGLNAEYL